jgi:hypothetical protein
MISNEEIQKKKHKAIDTFISTFGGSYQPQVKGDVDYKIFKDGELIAYMEVTIRNKTIATAYPLIVPAARMVKLADKRLNPVLMWACDDGVIYARLKDVEAQIKWGSLLPHLDLAEHGELMCYYAKQKHFKYIKYS